MTSTKMSSLKFSLYSKVIEEIHKDHSSLHVVKHLVEVFPNINSRTLGSIFAQEYQRKTKRNHHQHNSPESVNYYYKKYLEGIDKQEPPGVLLRLSSVMDISPCILSRIILERYLITKESGETVTKHQISKLLKDTSLIDDGRLALEIYLCVLNDDNYGPLADLVKHSIGHEYECKLKKWLEEKSISFLDESEMRTRGYDKTPDFRLEIPFAMNGFIVNWVESKASFGDEESHQTYLKDQFWSYWNRFGSGLVVYWFGYIEELDVDRHKGIMLQCDFPKDIVIMNPTSI